MPTVSEEIAQRVIDGDGWYDPDDKDAPDNPEAWCVFKYFNVEFDKEDWAICFTAVQFSGYLNSPNVGRIEMLWKRKSAAPGIDMLMEATGRL